MLSMMQFFLILSISSFSSQSLLMIPCTFPPGHLSHLGFVLGSFYVQFSAFLFSLSWISNGFLMFREQKLSSQPAQQNYECIPMIRVQRLQETSIINGVYCSTLVYRLMKKTFLNDDSVLNIDQILNKFPLSELTQLL